MERQEKTKIWTFQSAAQLQVLLRNGVLYGDWMQIGLSSEQEMAYRSMCRMMASRKLSCGNHPPIWAWHSCGAYQQAPDAKVARMLLSDHQLNNQIMLLSLECSADQMLLSDYSTWCQLFYSSITAIEYAAMGMAVPSEEQKERLLLTIDYTGLDSDVLVQATLPCISKEFLVEARQVVLDNNEVCVLDQPYLLW
ncbi:hypothetical protein WAE56_21075 [Iodobacter sp. LRB]|uniref:hypothetical protein n=1 Tax=unclassified Iodobacter TaxID=235634 RepID=UPI00117B6EFD